MSDVDSNLKISSELIVNTIQKKYKPLEIYFGDLKNLIPEKMHLKLMNSKGVSLYTDNFDFPFELSQKELENIFNGNKVKKTVGNRRFLITPYKYYGKLNILILGKKIKSTQETIEELTLFSLSLIIFIFLISFLSSVFIINRMLGAIVNINNVAKKITEEDLSHRIEIDYKTKEIENLVKTLNSMLDRIEQGFSKVKQFTADVSHELKTPITSIKNTLEVELSADRTKIDYKNSMGRILEDINWVKNIINDLLLMSKLDMGKWDINFENFKIYKAVYQALELMRIMAEEKRIQIEFSNSIDKELEIRGDKNQIKRVILNIISNAIKYTRKDGHINIDLKRDDGYVELKVRDSGIGIKKENISKVTERFYREDRVRTSKKNGTGLGLAISKYIIDYHRGILEIDSSEGEGTLVSIRLPLE
ncbi:MAG: ATP-binding protein [Fusobacteriota bacterium]